MKHIQNIKNILLTGLLILACGAAAAERKEIANCPVQENVKYLLTMDYKVLGNDVLELNDRIREIQTQSDFLLPGWQMDFYDADAKVISSRRLRGMTFIRRQGTMTDIFYAPPGAASVKVFSNVPKADNDVSVKVVSLIPAPDEQAINCNPLFLHKYAGWQGFLRGTLLRYESDGIPVFDSAYGCGGERFPLQGAGRYRLYACGEGYGYFRTVLFFQYDRNGKQIKRHSLGATVKGNKIEFDLEPEAVSGNFVVYNTLLREIRLTKIK